MQRLSAPSGPGTAAAVKPQLHELARRSGQGIVVRLLWNPASDDLVIRYHDRRSGETFAAPVPRGEALEAFRHPNVYRPRSRRAVSTRR